MTEETNCLPELTVGKTRITNYKNTSKSCRPSRWLDVKTNHIVFVWGQTPGITHLSRGSTVNKVQWAEVCDCLRWSVSREGPENTYDTTSTEPQPWPSVGRTKCRGQSCPRTAAETMLKVSKAARTPCGQESSENVLCTWHINTQSSAADYQSSTEAERGGLHDSTTEVCVHYRPLCVLWPLAWALKTTVMINGPIMASFYLFFNKIPILKAGLRQGWALSISRLAGCIPELVLIWSCIL